MPRFDVTTFGEGGLRLSVPVGRRIEQTLHFDVKAAGTEANVVGALAQLGWACGWVSGLPDTPPGRRVAHSYRGYGIDLSAVRWRKDGRVSVYYVEYAEPPRPIKVYYDRKDSSFSQLLPEDIDWGYMLDTRHVHMSGLTQPLSPGAEKIIRQALERARDTGATTSFDVNYRQLLWTPEEARERLLPVMRGVDILVCGRRDAEGVFGCHGEPEEIVEQLAELSSAKNVVVSLSKHGLIGWDGQEFHRVSAREVSIVDRIGAGDAMVAGVLHGWLGGDLAKGFRYGAVLAALAMSQHGDTVVTTRDELDELLSTDFGDIVR